MLKAKDFKRYAREALAGRWIKAGFASVVAGFLGASIGVAGTSASSVSGGTQAESDWFEPFVQNLSGSTDVSAMFVAIALGLALVVLAWAIVIIIIGGATTLGYAKYNLNLVDNQNPKMNDLFSQYNRLGTGFGMQFFRTLYVSLWSLLFVIPGIIANYSYFMTPFILCENPNMTAREAIKESKQLMKGNKWRLFCLELSFYGWYLLAALVMIAIVLVALVPMVIAGNGLANAVLGITAVVVIFIVALVYSLLLSFVLVPYITAAYTVFYREICKEKYANDHSGPEVVDYVYENVPEKEDFEYTEV